MAGRCFYTTHVNFKVEVVFLESSLSLLVLVVMCRVKCEKKTVDWLPFPLHFTPTLVHSVSWELVAAAAAVSSWASCRAHVFHPPVSFLSETRILSARCFFQPVQWLSEERHGFDIRDLGWNLDAATARWMLSSSTFHR